MALVKVGRLARITLPGEIGDAAKFKEGDVLEAQVTKDGILLRRVTGQHEPTPAQEAEIQDIVDAARAAYAAERRH